MKHSAVEGLLRGLDVAPGSPEYREVARLCGGTEHPPPEIPVERYVAVLEYLAQQRFPDLPLPEGLFQVGAAQFAGYRKTMLGAIQFAALHLFGPERLTRKTPENLGRNCNFGERTVEALGPRRFALRFRGVPIPADYYRGIFTTGLRFTGGEAVRVTFDQRGEDTDFDLSW